MIVLCLKDVLKKAKTNCCFVYKQTENKTNVDERRISLRVAEDAKLADAAKPKR